MSVKKKKIPKILKAMDPEELLKPNEVADKAGINRNTLSSYLEAEDVFPVAHRDPDSQYRYYKADTVERLILFKALRAKPFRMKKKEALDAMRKVSFEQLWAAYRDSNKELRRVLEEAGLLTDDDVTGQEAHVADRRPPPKLRK